MERVALLVPVHDSTGQGDLLAHHKHKGLAPAAGAPGGPPDAADVLTWVPGEVEEHHMVHVGKVNPPRSPVAKER